MTGHMFMLVLCTFLTFAYFFYFFWNYVCVGNLFNLYCFRVTVSAVSSLVGPAHGLICCYLYWCDVFEQINLIWFDLIKEDQYTNMTANNKKQMVSVTTKALGPLTYCICLFFTTSFMNKDEYVKEKNRPSAKFIRPFYRLILRWFAKISLCATDCFF